MSANPSKVSRRAFDYVLWRFPGLLTLVYSKKKRNLSLILFAGLVAYLIAGIFGMPALSTNGLLDNLLSTPLQLGLVILLVWILVRVRVASIVNGLRVRENKLDNPRKEHIVFLHNRTFKNVRLDCSEVNKLINIHEMVEASLRFLPIDRDDFFRLGAGGLDVPKLAFSKLEIVNDELILKVQSTSFYATFFTHYFADYPLSMETTNEEKYAHITLRSIYSELIEKHVKNSINSFEKNNIIQSFPYFPNPLGITGVCCITWGDNKIYVVRKRDANVIGDANAIDWSFSGLVECHRFLTSDLSSNLDFEYLCKDELMDELFGKYNSSINLNYKCRPLALIFNPKYLYQPELVLWVDLVVNELEFSHLKNLDNIQLLTRQDIVVFLNTEQLSPRKAMFAEIAALVLEVDASLKKPAHETFLEPRATL